MPIMAPAAMSSVKWKWSRKRDTPMYAATMSGHEVTNSAASVKCVPARMPTADRRYRVRNRRPEKAVPACPDGNDDTEERTLAVEAQHLDRSPSAPGVMAAV